MKKLITLLAVLTVLIGAIALVTVSAATEETVYSGTCGADGDNLTWTLDTATGELVISGEGYMKNYSFTYGATNAPWYAYISSIKNVTIKNGVTSIGDGAFYNCSNLTSVTIPNSVTSIGWQAFSGCTGLTSIEIPNSVTRIDSSAFSGCSGLTSVTIPNSVMSIGNYAFNGCSGLTSVTVDDENEIYHSEGNCLIETQSKTLIKGCNNSVIPTDGSVTSIGEAAFSNCTSLTSVTIPDSVTSIGDYAFMGCSGLTSVTIGNSVTSIGDYAFMGCYKLVEVINHSTLNITEGSSSFGYIGYYADTVHTGESKIVNKNDYLFYTHSNGVHYLLGYVGNETELTLPNDYNGQNYDIYEHAFRGCSGLTSVTIPDSVTSIGEGAFRGCSGLTSVYITDLAAWCNIKFDNSISNPLYYANNLYLNGKLVTELVVPDSVTNIGNFAFYNCTSLTSVTIPNSITSIGGYAFSDCTGLTSVTIPNSVTSIGYSAFGGCSGLTSVTIPDSVTSIESYAFGGCSGLTSVTIPDSVTSIGDGAFEYCTSLTSVKIGNGLTTINAGAFSTCTNLSEVSYCGSESQWAVLAQSFPSTISVTRHNYSISEITTKPTHMTEGVMTFTCSFCGDNTKTTSVDKLPEHTYNIYEKYSVAEHKILCECKVAYEFAPHSWNDGVVTIQPTHTDFGTKIYTCSDCGDTKLEAVDKLPEHEYGSWGKHNATQHISFCSCGDIRYADHVWNNGVIIISPTTENGGIMSYTCSECGETKTEALEKLKVEVTTTETITAQTTVANTTVPPTDTTANNEADSGCGSYLGGGVSVILLVSGLSAVTLRKKKRK